MSYEYESEDFFDLYDYSDLPEYKRENRICFFSEDVTPSEKKRYFDFREEGYSAYEAQLMAGIIDPPEY